MEDKSTQKTKKSSESKFNEKYIAHSIYNMAEYYLKMVQNEGKFVLNCEDAFLKAIERLPDDDHKRLGRSLSIEICYSLENLSTVT